MDVALEYGNGPRKGERELLHEEITILGKDPDCEIRISSSFVSRQHCQISRTGQNVVLHDLGSRNGTFLNGRRVRSEALLNNEDKLSVGKTAFTVRIGENLRTEARTAGARTEHRSLLTPLVGLMEEHDALFGGRAETVRRVAEMIAAKIGLGAYELEDLADAALLANLGMARVPREILYSREPLTDEQWAVIRRHPDEAVAILAGATVSPAVLAGIRHHHERYDGTGYPAGLSRDGIPKIARVLAVAEALVAMTSARPYRGARDLDAVRQEVQSHGGEQFDPAAASAAAELLGTREKKLSRLLDGTCFWMEPER